MKHVFSFFIYFLLFSYCFSLQADSHGSTFNQYKGRVGMTDIPLPSREHVEGPDYILLPPVAEQKAYFEARFTDSLSRKQARAHTAPSTHIVDSCNGSSANRINANGGNRQPCESFVNNDGSQTIQLIPAPTDGVITYGIVDPSPYWVLIKSVERVPYFSVIPMRLLPPAMTHDSINTHVLSDYKDPSPYDSFSFKGEKKRPVTRAGNLKLSTMSHQNPEPVGLQEYAYEQRARDARLVNQLSQACGVIYVVYNLAVGLVNWCNKEQREWDAFAPYRNWNQQKFRDSALAVISKAQDADSFWTDEHALASYQYALLAEYELYQFYGYVNFLRTLPEYESYIIALYEGMCAEEKPYLSRRGQCKRYLWRPLWWDSLAGSCHNSFLENVRMQYVYIKNEQMWREKKEELRAKQEQDALEVSRQKQKAELEQHIAQEKIKSEVKWAYEQSLSEKQKEVLQHLHKNRDYMDDCTETYNQTLSKGDVSEQEAQRLQQRIEAIAQTLEENRAFEPIKYPLSRQVADLLYESCIESNAFNGYDNTVLIDSIEDREIYLDGLPIQHCIQQEINAVLNKVADLCYTLRSGIRNSQLLKLFTNSVGKMSYVAVESAKEGRVPFAMEVSDFCVHVSDQFEKGFLEGLCCLEEECFDVVHKALDSVVSAAKSDWCAGTKGKTGYSIAIQDFRYAYLKTSLDRLIA